MAADVAAEEQFGPYLVYERLGVGGMATVHRALERGVEGFERTVALKRLLPHLAEDASFIKSFVREAKLASLLNHVNIVQIFELGRVGTQYFISMEYIDGKDIRRILRHARKFTGPPPLHVTVGILLQLCEALDYAHTKADDDGHPLGLVHRDVSPSNLLLTTAGHLKVIDFGIAKAHSSQLRTQTGRVKGKLAYMAPEAIAGKDLDSRSDVFAAGVIAHELLTARPLFASKNEYQTLLKVQRGDILPPSTHNPACLRELDAIVLHALARDPDERYRGAAEMREELIEFRRRAGLQTTYRDIAGWIDWAFSIESPSAAFAKAALDETSTKVRRAPTPRPRREDEEAVEIAWGGSEADNAGPVVLDDIPDVSEKHLGVAPSLEVHGLEDDIPTPLPSHGTRSRELAARRDPSDDDADRRSAQQKPPSVPPGTILSPADRTDRKAPTTSPPRRATLSRTAEVPAIPDVAPPASARRITAQGAGVVPDDDAPIEGTDPTNRTFAAPAADVDVDIDLDPGDLGAAHEPADTVPNLPQVPRTSIARQQPVRNASEPDAVADPGRIPRTKPGMMPAVRARPSRGTGASPMVPAIEPGAEPVSHSMIGAAMIERGRRPRGGWKLIVGLVLAALAVTAIVLYTRRSSDPVTPAPPPPPRTSVGELGTLRFVLGPADVEIRIDTHVMHVGSTWETPLAPGIHEIEFRRAGYVGWMTQLDLKPSTTEVMRVVLEPLGVGTTTTTDATLILSPSPAGLEAVLDGQLLAVRTPIRMPIKLGPHTIALRRDGVELWHQTVQASASIAYAFSPVLERPRELQPSPPDAADPPLDPATTATPSPALPEPAADAEPPPADAAPIVELVPPADATVVVRPAIPPPPPPPPPLPTTIGRDPVVVTQQAVTKLSGETPQLAVAKTDVPAVVAAKVCIDVTGAVKSVDVVTHLDHRLAADLVLAIRTWRYAPYKQDNVVRPACFVVSFRVK